MAGNVPIGPEAGQWVKRQKRLSPFEFHNIGTFE